MKGDRGRERREMKRKGREMSSGVLKIEGEGREREGGRLEREGEIKKERMGQKEMFIWSFEIFSFNIFFFSAKYVLPLSLYLSTNLPLPHTNLPT